MVESDHAGREGSLEAPTRHAIDWQSQQYSDEDALYTEMERIFDICSGCRRCFSLCNAFPTMFDLIDESETMDLEGVERKAYWRVVDHCYLCDMCYMSKCPYVPPHPWNVDFPHLMLRAKAFRHEREGTSLRNKALSSTDAVGRFAGIPIVVKAVNAANESSTGRKLLDKALGVHPDAVVPKYHSDTLRKRLKHRPTLDTEAEPVEGTRGRVVLFTTCYGNFNKPELGEDLVKAFEHNGIPVMLADAERCCGMPKLELGDLEAVEKLKAFNVPRLAALVDEGWDIVAPIPSCVLMFKQELPLMFPEEADVAKVRNAIYDPFEYLMLRHKGGKLKTEFAEPLGRVAYHIPCHLRVQNLGYKTRDVLNLIPDTDVQTIERCSGHNGTYALKREYHDVSMKIGRPVFNRVKKSEAAHYASDCPMAADQIQNGLDGAEAPEHPLSLLRRAYGL